jgi:hypothetical protein
VQARRRGDRPAARRNNQRMGFVVLAAITTAAVTAMTLPSLLADELLRYEFRAGGDEDLSGVERGTPVLVAGFRAGRVTGIDNNVIDGTISFIVRFEIVSYPALYAGARARLIRDPVSNQAQIDFYDAGEPTESMLPLAEGSVLPLGPGPEDVSVFLPRRTMQAMSDAWDRIGGARASFGRIVDDARTEGTRLRDDAQMLAEEIRTTWPETRDRVQALVDRYGRIREDYDRLVERFSEVREAWSGVGPFVTGDGRPLNTLRTTFERLQGRWNELEIASTPVGPSFSRISERGAELRTRFERAAAAFADLGREFGKGFGFSEIAADLTLAADQFARLTSEATRAPWTVLVPRGRKDDELRDGLDDAMRELLRGLQQAKSTHAALEKVLADAAFAPSIALEGADELVRRLDDLDRWMRELEGIEEVLYRFRTDGAKKTGQSTHDGR